MRAKIVIYTAIFGNYDGLIPQPTFPGIDYICFTDKPMRCKLWEVIEVVPQLTQLSTADKYRIFMNSSLFSSAQ